MSMTKICPVNDDSFKTIIMMKTTFCLNVSALFVYPDGNMPHERTFQQKKSLI